MSVHDERPWPAAYKCPRRVTVVDEVPTTPSGTVLRRELRARGGS